MTKITLCPRRPRNPLVAAALARQAGSHRRSGAAERQHAKRQLQRALKGGTDWHSP